MAEWNVTGTSPQNNTKTNITVSTLYILGVALSHTFHWNDPRYYCRQPDHPDHHHRCRHHRHLVDTDETIHIAKMDEDRASLTGSQDHRFRQDGRRRRRRPSRHDREDSYEMSPPSPSGLGGGGLLCCGSCFGFDTKTPGLDDDDHDDEEGGTKTDSSSITPPILEGNAFDIIVVQSADGKLFQNSDFIVSFPGTPLPLSSSTSTHRGGKNAGGGGGGGRRQRHMIVLELEGKQDDNNDTTKAWFPILHNVRGGERIFDNGESANERGRDGDVASSQQDTEDVDQRFWGCCHPDSGWVPPGRLSTLNHTLQIGNGSAGTTPDDDNDDENSHADPTMALLPFLKPGRNSVRYLLIDDTRVVGVALASLFLWQHTDHLVLCDIDGTITRSNVGGVIDTLLTKQYEYCHEGICQLLSRLVDNAESFQANETNATVAGARRRVLYVTSRPLALANPTRTFLNRLKQGDAELPEGPLLGFNGNLLKIGIMEAITKSTHHFKAETIWKNAVEPFQRAKRSAKNHTSGDSSSLMPYFVAGFGNTLMDMRAYHAVGVGLDRLFLISKQSKIVSFGTLRVSKESALVEDHQSWASKNTFNETGLHKNGTFTFQRQSWYTDQIGSKFEGYGDPRLMDRLESFDTTQVATTFTTDDDSVSVLT